MVGNSSGSRKVCNVWQRPIDILRLDSEVVAATNDFAPATFTPPRAPRVANNLAKRDGNALKFSSPSVHYKEVQWNSHGTK
jgi:hypothetical protein